MADVTHESLLVAIPVAILTGKDGQVLGAAVIQSSPGIVALQPHAPVAKHLANKRYHVSLDLRASHIRR